MHHPFDKFGLFFVLIFFAVLNVLAPLLAFFGLDPFFGIEFICLGLIKKV